MRTARWIMVVSILLASIALSDGARAATDWTGWEYLGGTLAGKPAAAGWPGHVDVFVRGTDQGLYHAVVGVPGYQALGGTLGPPGSAGQPGWDPAAVSWAPGRTDVFVVGSDQALWHLWSVNGAWSQWERLGGQLTGSPGVSSWGPGRLDVFGRGTDGELWHLFYDNAGWSHWEQLGGAFTGGPAAVSWSAGRIDLFVHGTDDRLYHRWFAGAWSGWEGLNGMLTSDPAASSWAAGRLDVFVRGTDATVYQLTYAGGWGAFAQIPGGAVSEAPGAVSPWANRIDLFARGSDNALYHRAGGPPTPPPPPPQPRTFGDDTYVVNQQLAPGTYRMRHWAPGGACYWERLRGFSGTFDDIIANDFTPYNEVVSIEASDVGFTTDGCGAWSSDLSAVTASPTSPFPSGQWIVGTDVAAGIWTAPGGSSCYWERESGFSGAFNDIIANDFDRLNPTVTISSSDRGFKTSDCGGWSKIG